MKHPFSRDVLMTPGPVEERLQDRLAGLAATMHHRTPEFQDLYLRAGRGVARVMGTEGRTALIAASGSGGLEAAVTNFLRPGDVPLVVVAGKFGQRWQKLLSAFGHEPVVLEKEPGRVASPEEIAARAEASGATALFATLQETSTGVRHDIQGFGRVARERGMLLVVDAVSGLGALPYAMDDWGVDVTVAGSQKGLLSPPGLAVIAWGDRAEERRADADAPRFYFDLGPHLKDPARSPFTPPVSLVAQLVSVLDEIQRVGLETILEAVAAAAAATLAGAGALGLEPLSPEGERSVGLSTLRLPDGVDGTRVPKDAMAFSGVRMAGGQDSLKGKIVRIGHMGATSPGDLLGCLAGLEHALRLQGVETDPGAGVAAAARTLSAGAATEGRGGGA